MRILLVLLCVMGATACSSSPSLTSGMFPESVPTQSISTFTGINDKRDLFLRHDLIDAGDAVLQAFQFGGFRIGDSKERLISGARKFAPAAEVLCAAYLQPQDETRTNVVFYCEIPRYPLATIGTLGLTEMMHAGPLQDALQGLSEDTARIAATF